MECIAYSVLLRGASRSELGAEEVDQVGDLVVVLADAHRRKEYGEGSNPATMQQEQGYGTEWRRSAPNLPCGGTWSSFASREGGRRPSSCRSGRGCSSARMSRFPALLVSAEAW